MGAEDGAVGALADNVRSVNSSATAAGPFVLPTDLGDYAVVVPPELGLELNQAVDFTCPVCSASLTSRRNDGMAELVCKASDGSRGVVAFARAYGRHATYHVGKEAVRAYGEHAVATDINYWGAGPD